MVAKVLFGGGIFYSGNSWIYSNTVDIYDTASGTWSTATLSQGRQYLSAATAGNQVLFAGGSSSSGPSNVVDIYTLQSYPTITSTKAWTLVDQTTVTGRMQLNSGASLNLGSDNLTVGSMSGAASINLGSGILTVGSDSTTTTYSGAISGGGSVATTGNGTLFLTGSNTYTGPTTITLGKLTVDGWLTNSPVTVNGGTLGGTGHLSSGTVSAGGQIAPGNPLGTLNFSGGLFLAAGSQMDYDLDLPDTSSMISCGNLVLGSPLQFSSFDFTTTTNFQQGTYYLIEANSLPDGSLGTSTSARSATTWPR